MPRRQYVRGHRSAESQLDWRGYLAGGEIAYFAQLYLLAPSAWVAENDGL